MSLRRLSRNAFGVTFLALAPFAGTVAAQVNYPVEVVPQLGHASRIRSVAFSNDGRFALSSSEDRTVKLWEIATGKVLRTFRGHTNQVTTVALSADDRLALSGSMDKTLMLWDVATGKVLRTFTGHTGTVESVALSRDGRYALSGSDFTGSPSNLKLWEVSTGKEIRSFGPPSTAVYSVSFSSDGRLALSGNQDATMRLWEVATGKELGVFGEHTDIVHAVAFSPDGRFGLSGSYDGSMKLWDLAARIPVRTFKGPGFEVKAVAFSPDGRFILSGSYESKLWEVATGKEIRSHDASDGAIDAVTFSPDGRLALTGGNRKLNLWDVATGKDIRSLGARVNSVGPVAISSDGDLALAGGEDGTLKLWELSTGKKLRTFSGHTRGIEAVVILRDGRFALSGSWDGTLKLWEISTGKEIRSFRWQPGEVGSVALSPSGHFALSGSGYTALKLWDVDKGKMLRTFNGAPYARLPAAFSPDDRFALTAGPGSMTLWDVATGREVRKFEFVMADDVCSIEFSPDGRFALSGGTTMRLWEVSTGKILRTYEGADFVCPVVFSPDGRFALSSNFDRTRTMQLWDVPTGKNLGTFPKNTGVVSSAAFLPNGRLAVSAGSDGAIRLLDIEKRQELASMIAASEDEWITITPKGFFLAAPKGTDLLNVVRGVDSYLVLQFYEHLARPDLVSELLKGDLESKYRNAANVLNLETILDSGPAPKIERIPGREVRERGAAKFAVRLTDRGGGIGTKLTWRVNGVVQGPATAPGLDGHISPGRYVIVEQSLSFDGTQKNEVEVVAYNARGLVTAVPLRFTVDPVFGIADRPPPRLFVLTIGVDNYIKTDWRLGNAVNDASAIAQALKAVGSSIFSDRIDIIPVYDAAASATGIDAAFKKLKAAMKPGDVFILFLSGHGRSIAGSGPGTGWFFLPQDLNLGPQTVEKNGIGQDKWTQWLSSLPPGPSLIILDACEAGASEAFRGGDREHETAIGQLQYATGRNVIAAAPRGKAAYEGYQGHGILTYTILEALNMHDGIADEIVDVYGIATNVSRRVPEISLSQFGILQKPEPVLKDNFPLGFRKAILKSFNMECNVPRLSAGPTHIITRTVDVRQQAAEKTEVTGTLPRNSLVTLKACTGAWGLISRGGKDIGYVPLAAMEAAK